MLLEVLQRGLRGASKDLFEALGQLASDRHWSIRTEASHQILERGDDAIRRLEHDEGLIAAHVLGEELAERGRIGPRQSLVRRPAFHDSDRERGVAEVERQGKILLQPGFALLGGLLA